MIRIPAPAFLSLVILTLSGPLQAQTNDVEVTLDQFGIGSAFRPGDMTPMRLILTSHLDEPTLVWVQWQLPNADGDIAEYGRSLALTPEQDASCWLYAPLSPDTQKSTRWIVRVFRYEDNQRGQEIGGARIAPGDAGAQRFEITTSMIGVIGRQRMGLGDLAVLSPQGMPIASHEATQIVWGIKPDDLPDRWFGLRHFEAIAWGDANQNPPDITTDQAEAIRQYVQRGGHLIIALPAVGNPWGLGTEGQNPLEDLLPQLIPNRVENVPYKEILPILSKSSKLLRNATFDVVNFFGSIGEENAPLQNSFYEPLVVLPDGRVVVIQRTYGFGRVTVIGVDIASDLLRSMGLPEGDAFWNRILSRRADTPSPAEMKEIGEADRRNKSRPSINTMGSGNLYVQMIQHDQKASVGAMLAFLLFFVYWCVAGVGSFFVLKHYKQEKHAWVAFAAAAGLFTAIAWGAVSAVRPGTVNIKHVTILDHIARSSNPATMNPDRGDRDRQYQRATSYFAAFLPGYQTVPIGIDSSAGQDLLYSFDPPGINVSKFPNVDVYRVDIARNAAMFSIPSRSTTSRFYANWMGSTTDWGGMLHEDTNDPIVVRRDATGTEVDIHGTIINDLPGELTNVTIIWIKNQRTRPLRYETSGQEERPWVRASDSGQMLNIGSIWKLSGLPIAPNEPFLIDPPDGKGITLSTSLYTTYVKGFVSSGLGLGNSSNRSISQDNRRKFLEMLSFFQQLPPPKYLKAPTSQGDQQSPAFVRELGRELDLSPWFSRPCLIVIGQLQNSALPIPLVMDEEYTSEGLTVVRWIFPLPLDEEIAFKNIMKKNEN